MLFTHTLWMFYFITNGCQNSKFCNIASIPRRNYEKSYRLKQRSLIGQPSLRTAVSQACPSGRILSRVGVATQDWLLSHDRSSAVPRLAAAHWTTHQRPPTIRWPVIVQHKLPTEDCPLWRIRFDFRPKTDCRQKIACEKERLQTWIMLCIKYDFVVIADYFCTMTFRY